jgi:hypothetical protein
MWTHQGTGILGMSAIGGKLEVVGILRVTLLKSRECRLFEVPTPQAANPVQELQIEKRHQNHRFAGAHNFPKFVKGGC